MTAAQKEGYPTFMLKEINEQPAAINRTIMPRIKDGLPSFEEDGIPDSFFADCNDITIVACGTAMYAGMVGKTLMQDILGIPVTVAIASEFRYERRHRCLPVRRDHRYVRSSASCKDKNKQDTFYCKCERFFHCQRK